MSVAELGQFDDLLHLTREPLRPVMERLRALILKVHPEAYEVVRLRERAASYGCGPRKMIEGYAYIMPFRSWVNLGFFRGTSLPDPGGRLQGTGAKLRHVKVRSIEDAERKDVRHLVEEAYAERRAALD